ncbi:TfdA family taurine dioxygenase [Coniophora puteana RWD-64-598 SS2]|uniref:TfdA family taurine dioxygenase n=1 Tax=Coniophora puteana (strain RWD-64-598) TaxID=741705 RepID=A0A5M3MNI1_CONPW|nr:TfdA family taurine dioxygenase [Coniophora puteana RWD-64-598 SS2]EIW80663.1 TfdA family taurine dioxygenase [Coniophora puteana RWD-64-598 SS2]
MATTFAGSLSEFPNYDVTNHIGTRFYDSKVQLSELVHSENADGYILDLAKLVSERGVVYFTNQNLDIKDQLALAHRMGVLTGKPADSKLHKHPISEDTPELGAEVSVISSMGGIARARNLNGRRASIGWHADITFERVPSDYAILKMHTIPKVGGDTLWACGYEAYDRLSPAMKKFLEGMTAVHNAQFFVDAAQRSGHTITDNRGSPENNGRDLTAVHPVIRTHPVTGYKTLFVNKTFTKRIIELTPEESDTLLDYLYRHISENHDLQVRYRWEKNDIAIWDNRCTFHTATNDYDDNRQGQRAVGIGEKPYFDPASKSRRDVLNITF